jgi:hypothetical protein
MYQVTEKSTTFGTRAVFGLRTPFRFPNSNLSSVSSLMSNLATQLYPTGRAWYMLKNSVMEKFHSAINVSFVRLVDDARQTLDSCFPDNNNFSEDDCNLWEYRFGMRTNPTLSLAVRKEAIYRRMARGRNVPARQHIKYLEYQLQLAGFNVWLHENGFIEDGVRVFKKPQDIIALMPENVQHGGTTQHGVGVQHGGVNADVIANSYKQNELYSVADEYLWSTFFIGGENLGDVAEVPENRLEEFRELVLKLKPAHLVAFTFINYV